MITIRNKKGKRSKLFYFVWSAPLIGSACVLILLGYITYFSTDVLGLPSGLVGLLLLLSKIFDGVTDILAGYLIDRTNTRWGKARPYDITFAFYAIATLILFSIPNIGTVGTAILVFILYTMVFPILSINKGSKTLNTTDENAEIIPVNAPTDTWSSLSVTALARYTVPAQE